MRACALKMPPLPGGVSVFDRESGARPWCATGQVLPFCVPMLLALLLTCAQDPLPAPLEGLPEVLSLADGGAVEDVGTWRNRRRPELKAAFERWVYGAAPPPHAVSGRSLRRGLALGGRATFDEVELVFDGLPEGAPTIHLLLILPSTAEGPVPVFLGLNKCGNHTVLAEASQRQRPWIHEACGELGPGSKTESWCPGLLIERGFGLATFACADVDADRHEPSDGIQAYYPDHDWATLRAWAWGLSRALDHLETDGRVDSSRVSLIGHSRRGKAALLAAAFDERFALVVPHQSGTGGCALSRENDQETVERITRIFPHWFTPAFRRFSDKEASLPVDQHLLVALVAPRPLLETVGEQDRWANYDSSLIGLRAAAPVWHLHGAPASAARLGPDDDMPGPDGSRLVQLMLDEEHVLDAQYWTRILDFASLQLE
jgi:hypothetical protein